MTQPLLYIVEGDCLASMRTFPDACIGAVVTDPPYELGFMGKRWDASGIAFSVELWREVLRVLKPGGHLLAFSGTRTYHRMVCAIEDAGFEIRDQLAWMYGTGFPKSLNVALAIDKAEGVQGDRGAWFSYAGKVEGERFDGEAGAVGGFVSEGPGAAWNGWGTALKPAQEPIVLARKPLIGTVAANVLAHGTGGINVDACRIGMSEGDRERARVPQPIAGNATGAVGYMGGTGRNGETFEPAVAGRWPANVLLDEAAAAALDEQSGESKSGVQRKPFGKGGIWSPSDGTPCGPQYGDLGGASRFFYVAKASKAEREAGLDHLPKHSAGELTGGRAEGSAGLANPRAGAGRTSAGRANNHPTVKPIELMRYLVRLITPPGGMVLDPFAGSGTTGMACALEGVSFVGCEREPGYVEIARARIAHVGGRCG